MNKITLIFIGIVIIIGAAFVLRNFYAPDGQFERLPFFIAPVPQITPPQQLPVESNPSASQVQGQKATSSQVTPTPTQIPLPIKPPTTINGACGNSLNSCTSGTFQDITDISASYIWNCLGSNGGTNANCNLAKPPAASSDILDRIEAAIKEKLKR